MEQKVSIRVESSIINSKGIMNHEYASQHQDLDQKHLPTQKMSSTLRARERELGLYIEEEVVNDQYFRLFLARTRWDFWFSYLGLNCMPSILDIDFVDTIVLVASHLGIQETRLDSLISTLYVLAR